ncbi:spore coat protein GerQ [Brevibacillus dissolubilis]|uniref:spore coat protein GerQ n=1 Tax=Brevibacillus dissolubilis TaxID=1844116 RepID=UPI003F658FA7
MAPMAEALQQMYAAPMAPQMAQPYAQPISPVQPSGSIIPGVVGGVQTAVPGAVIPGAVAGAAAPFVEESYIENILRMNLGKVATIYQTFENNQEWNAKVFKGVLEAAGRDHIIISDPQTGRRYLLLMVNLDYITFDEPLEYIAPPTPGGIVAPTRR